jgi:co-chaperonin GroES (HSP10)
MMEALAVSDIDTVQRKQGIPSSSARCFPTKFRGGSSMIQVTGCRILVKPIDLTEHDETYKRAKAANLVLLEMSERKEQVNVDRGTVLQIGEKAHPDYLGNVKPGDKIGYAKFGGKFIKDGDETYLVINDEDIVCIFKD